MGWIMVLALALASALLLWLIGFPRRLWTVPATALMLGATGYAWWGSPGLPGASVAAEKPMGEIDPEMVALREAMFGRFNYSWSYFAQADAMARIGARDTAAKAMLIAVRRGPQDVGAWTGLGLTLAENDNSVSPAARFAFDRAMAIHPQHPGPPFFLGLAYVRAGQFAEAQPWWARAVALAPKEASYRPALEARLALLDRFLAAQAAQGRAPAPPTAPAP